MIGFATGVLGIPDVDRTLAVAGVVALGIVVVVVLRGWLAGLGSGGDGSGLERAAAAELGASSLPYGARTDAEASSKAAVEARLSSLGWFPWIAFLGAGALALIVHGYVRSRSGEEGGQPWFWVGLAAIVIPFGVRLAAGSTRTLERLLLVIGLTVLVYLVKVTHDPFAFTFADEFVHLTNSESVIRTGSLPDQNSIIAISPLYPGLASVTAAFASLTGLSGFVSGLIVIGLARVVLALALFVLFQRLTGSPRFAGLAVVFYACALNYLFWDAQFAYQSLAFPLAVLTLAAAVVRRGHGGDGAYAGRNLLWTATAIVGICAVVVTHHLTSYAVALLLLVIAAAGTLQSRRGRIPDWCPPWDLAVVAVIGSLGWLFLKAWDTTGYLEPIFRTALEGSLDVVSGSEGPRELFESKSGYSAPTWERVVSLGALALTACGVAFGALRGGTIVGSRFMFRLFVLAAGVYLASFGLRFVPSAWEVANRISDYAFIGVAALLAATAIRTLPPWRAGIGRQVAFGTSVGLLVVGATLTSWPATVRLPLPFRVAAAGKTFEPEGASLASWALRELGPGNGFAADASNGRMLLLRGRQTAYVAETPNARVLLEEFGLDSFQVEVLRETEIDYVVLDRRRSSGDNMAGYFFLPPSSDPLVDSGTRPDPVLGKFERAPGVSRLLDTGNVVVYDVRRLR